MGKFEVVYDMDVGKTILNLTENDIILKAKIFEDVSELSEIGLDMMRSKRLEFIEDKIYALRIFAQFSSIRIYLTPIRSKFICFYILEKKSNKIPRKDLDTIRVRYRRIKRNYEIQIR